MRTASRPAFPIPEERDDSSVASLIGSAVGGVIAISLILGTIAWAVGLTLVDAGAIGSSWSWWTFTRLAGLLHLTRGVMIVWLKRKG